jgi:transcriptional regulator with XRE-family HTH domain
LRLQTSVALALHSRGLVEDVDVSGDQVAIARGLVQWSQLELALRAGVNPRTVARFEAGELRASARVISALRNALETGGVRFASPAIVSLTFSQSADALHEPGFRPAPRVTGRLSASSNRI